MKRFILVFLLLFFILLSPQKIFAQPRDRFIHDKYPPYIEMGEQINIDREINSDAYLVGQKVVVNSAINGNLFVIGQNIEIKAPVNGSVVALAENVYIPVTGEIQKDVYGLIGNLNLEGRIGGSLNLAYSPESKIRIDGKIMKDLIYSQTDPDITDKAFIQGQSIREKDLIQKRSVQEQRIDSIYSKLLHAIGMILIGGMLLRWKPKTIEKMLAVYEKNTGKLLGRGLLAIVIVPIIVFALLISFIFIPVSLFLLAMFLFIFYLAPIPAGIFIGSKVLPNKNITVGQLITGILIFDTITLAPVLGLLVSLAAATLLLGLATMLIFPVNEKKN